MSYIILYFLLLVNVYTFGFLHTSSSLLNGISIQKQTLLFSTNNNHANKKPHVAVIGAGWGGWGAAKTLCESGCRVTLIDATSDPSGSLPSVTPTGKPFEAGMRGYWIDYPNINNLLSQLNISENEVFTEFTNSSFYSPNGLEATAPVFSSNKFPNLPSPLGQIYVSLVDKLFVRLPISDRVTLVGLLIAMLDTMRDDDVFESYDRMTAHDLFIRFGVSKRLVDHFLRPTLLVGLFKPPEELSAAVTMELLYYYALAHQNSFDVRWLKRGTVAENFFRPLYKTLSDSYDIDVIPNCRVTGIELNQEKNSPTGTHKVNKIRYSIMSNNSSYNNNYGSGVMEDLDGVVLAVGTTGMKSIITNSPEIASVSSQLSKAATLGGIDVMSVRLWLNETVPTRSPANVLSQFDELRGAGGTFFMLDQTQKDHLSELWGEQEIQGSVVGVDFYNAGALFSLSDNDLIGIIMDKFLPQANEKFRSAGVVDSYVKRYPSGVSWFSPGSYNRRPSTVVDGIPNLYCAGDWVIMGYRDPSKKKRITVLEEHGAKGLCQERAYVSGLLAGNKMIHYLYDNNLLSNNNNNNNNNKPKSSEIIPIRQDELQVTFGRKIIKDFANRFLKPFGLSKLYIR
eukprot:gene11604-15541_t